MGPALLTALQTPDISYNQPPHENGRTDARTRGVNCELHRRGLDQAGCVGAGRGGPGRQAAAAAARHILLSRSKTKANLENPSSDFESGRNFEYMHDVVIAPTCMSTRTMRDESARSTKKRGCCLYMSVLDHFPDI
jgi:hypothetical protein